MEKKYCGTYSVRNMGRKNGTMIHLPDDVSGDYAIFVLDDGNIHLVKVGVKE